jgi:hypothetical protein
MRGNIEQEREEYDALWRDLCDRVYPIRDALGVGDARKMYHQDLRFLTDMDLELDKLRARFRACLEADFSDRMWLLERIGKIEDEQARRAEEAWPPRDAEEIPVRVRREPDADPPPSQQKHHYATERAPARARLGHVGHHIGQVEMAELVRGMLEKLDRQASILAEGREKEHIQEQDQDGRGAR